MIITIISLATLAAVVLSYFLLSRQIAALTPKSAATLNPSIHTEQKGTPP